MRSNAWAQLGFELTGEDTYEQVALLLLYNMDALSSEVLDELNVRPTRASVGDAARTRDPLSRRSGAARSKRRARRV